MDFNTTRHFTSSELIDLNIAQNLASKISNYIGDAKSNGVSPDTSATDLCQIIDLINDLHSKVGSIFTIFKSADAMERHLKEFKP